MNYIQRINITVRKKCSILIFHRILGGPTLIDDCQSFEFEKKILLLKRVGGSPFGLREISRQKNSNKWLNYSITFDDGYADNFDVALPILQKHSLSATFFIASGYLNGGWMWNDGIIEAISKTSMLHLDLTHLGYEKYSLETKETKKNCIKDLINKIKYIKTDRRLDLAKRVLDSAKVPEPSSLMMTDEQIKKLHQAGMEIGGHTVNHPILSSVDKATARREICENKEYLEGLIGEPLHSFAYPNGKPGKDFDLEHVALVRDAGYRCAVTTSWGRVEKGSDLYQLPRFTPWNKNPYMFMFRLFFPPSKKRTTRL